MNGEYQLLPINRSRRTEDYRRQSLLNQLHITAMNGNGGVSYEELVGINGDDNLANEYREFRQNGKLKGRSYSKWSPTEHGATLVWRDVCVYAKRDGSRSGGKIQRIINNVSGSVTPGTLVALMGSSGAGKSTLMSALAYRSGGGAIVQGDILLNGKQIGPFMYRMSGFVHQDDLFYGSLTVHEHLSFMARLRLDRRVTGVERERVISDLLEQTGLKKSRHTRIGEQGEGKMLSGGEKKRLAFATELLTRPTLLFCDEPTTGLDAYSAQRLVATLQNLANRGTAVICTIHQPSSSLFAMFDQVLLLSEGRTAFMGAPKEAMDFFERLGYPCPDTYNPADFLISVLAPTPGCERASLRAAHRVCDHFAVSEIAQHRDLLINLETHIGEVGDLHTRHETLNYKTPLWPVTVFWLMWRSVLIIARDPKVQLLRVVQKTLLAAMIGFCFLGTIDLSQRGVQAVQGAIYICITENTFPPMYAVLAVFPQNFGRLVREQKAGLYDTLQYYLATTLAMLPGLIVEPLLFVVVAYWLAGLRPTLYAFSTTVLAAILVQNVATSAGFCFSAVCKSVPIATAVLNPFNYILMLSSGVFLRLSTLPVYVAWAPYISWILYAYEAMTIVQWDGVESISCPDSDERIPCFRSGQEVLEAYSYSPDNLVKDLWALLGLYVAFNLIGFFFLRRRVKCA